MTRLSDMVLSDFWMCDLLLQSKSWSLDCNLDWNRSQVNWYHTCLLSTCKAFKGECVKQTTTWRGSPDTSAERCGERLDTLECALCILNIPADLGCKSGVHWSVSVDSLLWSTMLGYLMISPYEICLYYIATSLVYIQKIYSYFWWIPFSLINRIFNIFLWRCSASLLLLLVPGYNTKKKSWFRLDPNQPLSACSGYRFPNWATKELPYVTNVPMRLASTFV